MQVTVTVNKEQCQQINNMLDNLSKTIQQRQKHARKIGGYVMRDARKNVKAQKTVEGAPFSPRARQRKRQKDRLMLQGVAKTMAVISKANEGGGVVVGWRNSFEGKLAGKHQEGHGQSYTAAYMQGLRGRPNYNAPCTRRQAQALLREGYKTVTKNGAPRRITVMQLEKSMKLGQAGLILRMMRTGKRKGAQSWRDNPPARPFLGVTDAQAAKHHEQLVKSILKAAKQ